METPDSGLSSYLEVFNYDPSNFRPPHEGLDLDSFEKVVSWAMDDNFGIPWQVLRREAVRVIEKRFAELGVQGQGVSSSDVNHTIYEELVACIRSGRRPFGYYIYSGVSYAPLWEER